MKSPLASSKPGNRIVFVRWNWRHHRPNRQQIFLHSVVKHEPSEVDCCIQLLSKIAKVTLQRVKEVVQVKNGQT